MTVGATMQAWIGTLAANWEREGRRDLEEDSPMSPMEIRLLEAFHRFGLEPEQQAEVGPYDADFLFRDAGLCVEVDGREFHDTGKDRRRDGYFRERGFFTLRFSGSEVYREPLRCALIAKMLLLTPARRRNAVTQRVRETVWLMGESTVERLTRVAA